jgi:hypothetical protein
MHPYAHGASPVVSLRVREMTLQLRPDIEKPRDMVGAEMNIIGPYHGGRDIAICDVHAATI